MTDWKAKAIALADELEACGHLIDPRWRAAVEAVPRHVFVPRFYDDDRNLVDGAVPEQHDRWLGTVYSNTSLVTQRTPVPDINIDWPTSSSSMPSLMVDMLEALSVADGHRVLEIGTGTGYNAALLCHRLGAAHVVSIDIDPTLVAAARDRLASLGYHPTLVVGDGGVGAAQHGPFDRIIATAAVPDLPIHPPAHIVTGMARYLRAFGLAFGAFDFVVTPQGDWVFLECNPSGQWLWLQERAGLPIAAALAEFLTTGVVSS